MHALAGQGIQVDRQGADQGLALAGPHFRDLALVQNDAADQLDIVVAHAEHPNGGLANHGEGFRKQIVEAGSGRQSAAELLGLAAQGLVAERFEVRLQCIDPGDGPSHLFDEPIIAAAEDAGE